MASEEKAILAALERRRNQRKLFTEYYELIPDPLKPPGGDNLGPYPWQVEFHNAGAANPERLLMAANRVGKTRSASAEVAIHATGMYPQWWKGRRFASPTKAWVAAETNEDIKGIIQSALLGPQGEHGTGWIPKDKLEGVSYRQAGVSEVMETIKVRHVTGGISTITAKTFMMEVRGFRGESLDVFWGDEIIPMDIYTEALTRLLDRRGTMIITFTPTEGPTDVVRHFMEAKQGSGIYIKNVTWDDISHLDPVEKARMINSYPAHERDTRARGIPMLGTGAVFPIGDETVSVAPFEIPAHWARVNGMDFGIDHPAAGAFCAHDRDTDTFYVYDGYKMPGETPIYHAAAMKKHGEWIPNSWPQDGLQREKSSNVALKDQYRKHSLYMLRDYAQYPDARGNSREAGLIEMYEYMRTGKFKVFSNLSQWFEEKRMYHRKDGLVVAKYDDLLSATRYAFMMRRFAIVKPPLAPAKPRHSGPIVGGRRHG